MQATDTQANTGTGAARGGIDTARGALTAKPIGREYADVRNRFTYHPPNDEQVKKYEQLRGNAGNLAMMISDFCPPGREKQLALTQLEQAVMWANAAIAREPDLKYHDEVVRAGDSPYYTVVRTFLSIGKEIRVDIPAKDLNLPVGQGIGQEAIDRRVLDLAGPQLEQGTTDIKAYLRANPNGDDNLTASIDSPAGLRSLATSAGDELGKSSLEEGNTSRR